MDAYDRFWQWAEKPLESPLTLPADLHQAVMELALAGLSHEQAPHGSAAFSVVQRVGAPFGVAVIAVILQNLLTRATSSEDALHAFNQTFWWAFGLGAIPLALAFLMPKKKQAGRTETIGEEASLESADA